MLPWNPTSLTSKGAKYLSLVNVIDRDIAAGRLTPGDRLPPQREIAEMFGVTIATVTKAIAEATRRGLVTARTGSGTFVARPGAAPAPGAPLIDLGLNTLPATLISDLLSGALVSLAQAPRAGAMFDYAPYTAETSDSRAVRGWLEDQGPLPAKDAVAFPIHGVQQGLLAAMFCLARRGQTVLVENLSYTGTLRAAKVCGLSAWGVAMDDQGMMPDALEQAIAEQGARLLVLTPTVQNPTGCSMGAERRKAIAEICHKHDVFLIEDAVNMPLAGCGERPVSSWLPERSILLSGLSKCVASGMRLGFAYVPGTLQGEFHEALVNLGWIAPRAFLTIAGRMVESGAMAECLNRNRAEARARRDIASRILGRTFGDGLLPAFHVWVDLPSGWSANSFSREALARGVNATSSAHFCTANTDTPAAMRLCLGATADRKTLEEGLGIMASMMEKSALVANPVF